MGPCVSFTRLEQTLESSVVTGRPLGSGEGWERARRALAGVSPAERGWAGAAWGLPFQLVSAFYFALTLRVDSRGPRQGQAVCEAGSGSTAAGDREADARAGACGSDSPAAGRIL